MYSNLQFSENLRAETTVEDFPQLDCGSQGRRQQLTEGGLLTFLPSPPLLPSFPSPSLPFPGIPTPSIFPVPCPSPTSFPLPLEVGLLKPARETL